MKQIFLSCLLFGAIALPVGCSVHDTHYHMPNGHPGDPPNIELCNPGHELSRHCHGK